MRAKRTTYHDIILGLPHSENAPSLLIFLRLVAKFTLLPSVCSFTAERVPQVPGIFEVCTFVTKDYKIFEDAASARSASWSRRTRDIIEPLKS